MTFVIIFMIILLVISLIIKKAFQYLPFIIIAGLMCFLLAKSNLFSDFLKWVGYIMILIFALIMAGLFLVKKFFKKYYSYESQENNRQRRTPPPQRSTNNAFAAYRTLNIPTTSSKDEVKKAYRELVKQHHPDKFVNANDQEKEFHEKKLKEINDAYEYIMKRYEQRI